MTYIRHSLMLHGKFHRRVRRNEPGEERYSVPCMRKSMTELVERIRSGQWKPGQLIPNEFEIAAEFEVSQGTARKAIGSPGCGQARAPPAGARHVRIRAHPRRHPVPVFQSVRRYRGTRIIPDSRSIKCVVGKANREEQKALHLQKNARVIRIDRAAHARPKAVHNRDHHASRSHVSGPGRSDRDARHLLRHLPEGATAYWSRGPTSASPPSRPTPGPPGAERPCWHAAAEDRTLRLHAGRPSRRMARQPVPPASTRTTWRVTK